MRETPTSTLARHFYQLFLDRFSTECESNRAAVLPIWKDKASWTALMLAKDTGFLSRTADAWAARHFNAPCSVKHEWHKFDLMLVSADPGSPWWRSVPILTIEHENDNGIQDEVWKLACWRSKLKVLITYHDHEAQEGEKRALASDIIASIQSDDDDAEWLLLSAPRTWRDRLAWSAHEWTGSAWHALSAE